MKSIRLTKATGSRGPQLLAEGPAAHCRNALGLLEELQAMLLEDPRGTATNYANCYAPTWGRHKSRTYPALGNHDYDSSATAVGYFGYFGAAADDPTRGYYSYDLGAWHVIVLNSNDTRVPTAVGSTQEQWLKADLAATSQPCVVAMWHRPRFYSTTSSTSSPTSSVKPFWDDLYAAGADLIVNAHMRDYERFAPQNPDGAADPVNGLREII